ncbi:hypothetical protein DFH08DRAFT_808533 [Mycena albidolilacea]|uniref:Uncharacterized protein n=1 Tax=Mycena albidolilacea TaxID=1033008 RepID=A0AAD7ER91_9AGAR|nr:hypothetical protein DFH08DRAFT_808533 [Mycena albidolilacea]
MSLNKRDSVWMKLFVAGLALLTTLKSLQSLAIMWIQNITMFGDREVESNIGPTNWVWGPPAFSRLPPRSISRCFSVAVFGQYLGMHILSSSALLCFCSGLFPASFRYAPSSFALLVLTSATQTAYMCTNTLELTTRWVRLTWVPSNTRINATYPRTSRNHPQPLASSNTAGK